MTSTNAPATHAPMELAQPGTVSYSCACNTGWTGVNCDQDIDECANGACPNGACPNTAGSHTCTCSTPGWTGDNCDQDINDCDPDPCVYGTCTDTGTVSYSCTCTDGFSGTNCDECEAGKGFDGSQCVDCLWPNFNNLTSHTAPCAAQTCPEGFGVTSDSGWKSDGGNCEQCATGFISPAGTGQCINKNDCGPNSCNSRGACTDGINAFTCACQTGWEGATCDTAKACTVDGANDSQQYACVNGALSGTTDQCVCTCDDGWEGNHCNQDVDECDGTLAGAIPPVHYIAIRTPIRALA